VLVSGLRELGVEVIECHRPLWELTRDKSGSFLSPRSLVPTALRFAGAWTSLLAEQRRMGPVDAVVTGYPAQPDVPLAAVCARARGVPLVVDALISFADTLVGDRQRFGPVAGSVLGGLDRFAVRRGDLVITDTTAHAGFFVERFGASPERTAVVLNGALADQFPAAPQPDGDVRAVFWGKLAPFHGVEVIVQAARMPGVPPVRILGDGQLGGWLEAEIARRAPPGFERVRWVPYEDLAGEIASASICLGVFGTSDKARRVIPNKVYEAMAVGRPIVTADTPAIREVLTDGEDALLVPPGEAAALADALVRLAGDDGLRSRLGENARRRFEEVGTPRVVARRLLDLLPDADGPR
jgi:glycosyltransferase involved in cell wall biosynthesis